MSKEIPGLSKMALKPGIKPVPHTPGVRRTYTATLEDMYAAIAHIQAIVGVEKTVLDADTDAHTCVLSVGDQAVLQALQVDKRGAQTWLIRTLTDEEARRILETGSL